MKNAGGLARFIAFTAGQDDGKPAYSPSCLRVGGVTTIGHHKAEFGASVYLDSQMRRFRVTVVEVDENGAELDAIRPGETAGEYRRRVGR